MEHRPVPLDRFRLDASGATAVEFALVLPLLAFLLFGMAEVGILGIAAAEFDNAVFDAARTIRTGQDDGPKSATAFETLVCSRMTAPRTECRERLTVSVREFDSFADTAGPAAGDPGGQFEESGPGAVMMVQAVYRREIISPMLAPVLRSSRPRDIVLRATAAFKNEPFG
ncbi:TadE/TadG family type IV pilus assembly protein [Phenylobacterium sp.]|jgi:Flp pilus assembly protein TadG|uniref:TadE/TadG family type IV pilus assembly protein n=1 Tax=Phenylobacterium sp. TaxID=1871053 RepID=UPI003783E286